MRLGKEQAAGYVEDTDRLEDTAPVEDTMTDALQAEEFASASRWDAADAIRRAVEDR